MANQRRFLGDLDAATDKDFENHFVTSNDLTRILTTDSDIVYGSKGVGKTALRRALTELNKGFYFTTKTIDLDQISFGEVHIALSKLKDTTDAEVSTLARNTWRNVLAIYCLEAVAEQLPASDQLRKEIETLLDHEGVNDSDSNNRLLSQIERFFIRIGIAGLEDINVSPLGLSINQRNVVNRFPSNPDVESLLTKCSMVVKSSKKYTLICIDGFDSIVDHTPESRKAIFAGLIDAIHKSSRDNLLTSAFCFKAFLPQELTDGAHTLLWDADKHLLNTRYLRWGEQEFQDFLRKRLLQYSKTKSSKFLGVWHDYMPDKIRNDVHRIEEASFSYVLRHTLYRPRQILTHLQMLLDKWDEVSNSFRIDPSFIPPVVANTNYQLAESIVGQLERKHSGLSGFMRSWNGTSNTLQVGEFQERIKMLGYTTVQDVNNIFDDLFNFGFFGVAPKGRVTKGVQQTGFKFSYVGDRFVPNIHNTVRDTDILALSPMFNEYCGCTASEYGIIVPSDR